MTKEQLRKIKDSIKATIKKLLEERAPAELEFNQIFEKISIMYNRILSLCNGNHEMARGVVVLALEELKKEAGGGDLAYILKKINEINEN